ncbi:hypothetical protein [Microcoleus sp. LEGE 07076]|uniref:hypothetical protein n=1 Tax=Microcoleus sp. LEGE 07076 TaxID=915322 RepID=UPI00187F75CF|nr:hypothetical protein [Microcoleus sp. LEGE 07076]
MGESGIGNCQILSNFPFLPVAEQEIKKLPGLWWGSGRCLIELPQPELARDGRLLLDLKDT